MYKTAAVLVRTCVFLFCDLKEMKQESKNVVIHLVSYQLQNYIEQQCV